MLIMHTSYSCRSRDLFTSQPHGRAFKVLDKDLLISDVIPNYFICRKYESFTRQLNGWGESFVVSPWNSIALGLIKTSVLPCTRLQEAVSVWSWCAIQFNLWRLPITPIQLMTTPFFHLQTMDVTITSAVSPLQFSSRIKLFSILSYLRTPLPFYQSCEDYPS